MACKVCSEVDKAIAKKYNIPIPIMRMIKNYYDERVSKKDRIPETLPEGIEEDTARLDAFLTQ
jgi:hypothetical protein